LRIFVSLVSVARGGFVRSYAQVPNVFCLKCDLSDLVVIE
jgi:hypothetical protein